MYHFCSVAGLIREAIIMQIWLQYKNTQCDACIRLRDVMNQRECVCLKINNIIVPVDKIMMATGPGGTFYVLE